VYCSNGVDYSVCAQLAGIVHSDIHSGFYPGSDNHRRAVQITFNTVCKRVHNGGDNRRYHNVVYFIRFYPFIQQKLCYKHTVFIAGFVFICGHAPVTAQIIVFIECGNNVCVANVNCKQHIIFLSDSIF